MSRIKDLAQYIRSKNAGPFWVTSDIFCDSDENYRTIAEAPELNEETVAALYHIDAKHVKIFRIPNLNVIKVSFPRRVPQGSFGERDMHSGQQYLPLGELNINMEEKS